MRKGPKFGLWLGKKAYLHINGPWKRHNASILPFRGTPGLIFENHSRESKIAKKFSQGSLSAC